MPARQTTHRLFFPVVIFISILLSAASWIPGKKETISSKPTLQEDFSDINPSHEWGTLVYSTATRYDRLDGMVVDTNGDVLVLFNSFESVDLASPFNDPSQIHVSRFTKDGDLEWQITLETDTKSIVDEYFLGNGVAYSIADSIILDNDGNAFVVGTTNWGFTFIAKLDPNGSVLWNKHFDIPNEARDHNFPAKTITVDSDGNLYLVNHLYDEFPEIIDQSQPWKARLVSQLTKVSSDGEVEWVNNFAEYGWGNYDDFEEVKDLVITDQSGFIYVVSDSKEPWGEPINAFSGDRDIAVAKFDSMGNLLWNTFLNLAWPTGNLRPRIDYIQIDTNNDILLAGQSEQDWGNPIVHFSEDEDVFLAKLDANGKLSWNTFLGGSGNDLAAGIVIGKDNNIFVIGSSPSIWGKPITSEGEDFIAQFNTNGTLLQNIFMDLGVHLIFLNGSGYAVGSGDNGFFLLSSGEFYYKGFENDIYEISLDKLNLYGTDGGFRPPSIYVPDITLHIPTPLDISTNPKIIGTNALLAVFLMLPFAVSVDVFSKIFSANEAYLNRFALIAWIGRTQKRLRDLTTTRATQQGLRDTLGLLSVIGFYGLIFSLLDVTWNPFSAKGIILFLSMAVAFGLVGLLDDIIQWRTIRKWGHQGEFSVRPANVFLAAASTAVSRLLTLVPGLMFGSPEALKINEEELSQTQSQSLARISMFTYVVIGLAAWLPTIATTLLQQSDIPGNAKNIIGAVEAFLLVIFAAALENVFVQLIGFSEGLGQKIRSWNKIIWGVSLALATFAFLHTLLNPHYDFVQAIQSGNITVFIAVTISFIVLTFGLQLYLRRKSKEAASTANSH
ncbi:MAG: hypothetical protein IT314_04065 [Anaerolineales bacterium]|nr:hypothetical protein [Anaerolineales bacterium]